VRRAPLLIEAGLGSSVDTLIVVRTDSQEQIKRLCKNTRLSRAALARRIRAQMPLSRKIRMADFIIDNNGTIGQTRRQVAQIIKKLRR
jgi:dephospho-CoA kinase